MNKIKIIDASNTTQYFEIPWEWISLEGLSPNLNDLESSAERGVTTGYLYRSRLAEIPEYTLKIVKSLKQSELYPLLKIIRKVKVNLYYFDAYNNDYVTREFYVPKPKITQKKLPKDNNTDNIIYSPFDLTFKGYGGV